MAKAGPRANPWNGVPQILSAAQISGISEADVAAFVGTEFDAIFGRGGDDGTPCAANAMGQDCMAVGKLRFGGGSEGEV